MEIAHWTPPATAPFQLQPNALQMQSTSLTTQHSRRARRLNAASVDFASLNFFFGNPNKNFRTKMMACGCSAKQGTAERGCSLCIDKPLE
jgi:hypothetical protein